MNKNSQHRTRRKLTQLLAAAAILVGVSGAFASPAQASTRFIGVSGDEARCVNSNIYYGICLYYNGLSSAFWGQAYQSDFTLQGFTFIDGGGSGYGQRISNNANAVDCTRHTVNYCGIFKGTNYTGYEDYLYWGQHGNLFLTWNAENSVGLY